MLNAADFSVPKKQLTGVYDLIAVLTHKGRSADSGHYVGWVKQDDGQADMSYSSVTRINCFALLLRFWKFILVFRKMDRVWWWQPEHSQGGRHFEIIWWRWATVTSNEICYESFVTLIIVCLNRRLAHGLYLPVQSSCSWIKELRGLLPELVHISHVVDALLVFVPHEWLY